MVYDEKTKKEREEECEGCWHCPTNGGSCEDPNCMDYPCPSQSPMSCDPRPARYELEERRKQIAMLDEYLTKHHADLVGTVGEQAERKETVVETAIRVLAILKGRLGELSPSWKEERVRRIAERLKSEAPTKCDGHRRKLIQSSTHRSIDDDELMDAAIDRVCMLIYDALQIDPEVQAKGKGFKASLSFLASKSDDTKTQHKVIRLRMLYTKLTSYKILSHLYDDIEGILSEYDESLVEQPEAIELEQDESFKPKSVCLHWMLTGRCTFPNWSDCPVVGSVKCMYNHGADYIANIEHMANGEPVVLPEGIHIIDQPITFIGPRKRRNEQPITGEIGFAGPCDIPEGMPKAGEVSCPECGNDGSGRIMLGFDMNDGGWVDCQCGGCLHKWRWKRGGFKRSVDESMEWIAEDPLTVNDLPLRGCIDCNGTGRWPHEGEDKGKVCQCVIDRRSRMKSNRPKIIRAGPSPLLAPGDKPLEGCPNCGGCGIIYSGLEQRYRCDCVIGGSSAHL